MKLRYFTATAIVASVFICGAVQPSHAQSKLEAPPVTEDKPATPAPKTVKATGDEPKPRVVEEIVARVNNDIITNVQLKQNQQDVVEEAKSDCDTKKCSPEELEKATSDAQANALRDLIDRDLLVQRAKDLDISVESDLIRELDDIRAQNKLETMEDLQKAVEADGQDYEEFKSGMRDHLLVDQVIYQEVGSKISGNIDREQMQKYYEAHKDEFVAQTDGVRIREILLSTENKPESEWPDIKAKAESYRERILKGEDFGDMAKAFSNGSTARDGGELGAFERGKLDKQIEDAVFKLNRNEMTPVIQTANGFLIIQVEERYDAGVQPFEKVENQVMNKIAQQSMTPKLREYLAQLRRDSFVEVRPGYTDTGAVGPDASIAEAKGPVTDDVNKVQKKPKKRKKLLIF